MGLLWDLMQESQIRDSKGQAKDIEKRVDMRIG